MNALHGFLKSGVSFLLHQPFQTLQTKVLVSTVWSSTTTNTITPPFRLRTIKGMAQSLPQEPLTHLKACCLLKLSIDKNTNNNKRATQPYIQEATYEQIKTGIREWPSLKTGQYCSLPVQPNAKCPQQLYLDIRLQTCYIVIGETQAHNLSDVKNTLGNYVG